MDAAEGRTGDGGTAADGGDGSQEAEGDHRHPHSRPRHPSGAAAVRAGNPMYDNPAGGPASLFARNPGNWD